MTTLLGGMRVLDLSVYRPMPHATQILADLGAEVLKVEPPGGDPMRAYPEIFASVARGKRSVVLDLRSDAGRARALELAADADVVCESWRPGVADRLGVGYDAVVAVNPSVVYCSLSGFGQDGPLRDVPGHDLNFQAIAGAARAPGGGGAAGAAAPGRGSRGRHRLRGADHRGVGPQAGNRRGGADRRRDGRRRRLVGRAAVGHRASRARRAGALVHPATACSTPPTTGGSRWASSARRACGTASAVGSGSTTSSGSRSRTGSRARPRSTAPSPSRSRRLDRDDAVARLQAEGAPVTPVLSPEEATAHPQLTGRAFHVESDAGLVAGLPVRFGGAAASGTSGADLPTHVPAPDEHPDGFTLR